MLRFVVAVLILTPLPALAGQATSTLSVGMRIVADPAVRPNKGVRLTGRPLSTLSTRIPARRYVIYESGVRIYTTEF